MFSLIKRPRFCIQNQANQNDCIWNDLLSLFSSEFGYQIFIIVRIGVFARANLGFAIEWDLYQDADIDEFLELLLYMWFLKS